MAAQPASSATFIDDDKYTTKLLDGQGQEFSRLIANQLLTKATFRERPYKLAIEFEEGEKFDDIAFYNGSTEEWWLIQAKHSIDAKEVTREALFTEKGDFSMLKYFKSYQSIQQNQKYGGKKIRLFLFTNRRLHKSIRAEKVEVDEIFSDGEHVQLFPEKEDIEKIKNFFYTDICDSFVKLFNGDSRPIQALKNRSKLVSRILTADKGYLKFRQSFLKNNSKTELYDRLRSAFSNKDMSKMETKVPAKCPDFWSNSDHDNAVQSVDDDLIISFLTDLVLSVSQPNAKMMVETIQTEWNNWMKNWIRPDVFRRLTEDELKVPFKTFTMCQLEWEDPYTISNKRPYLTLAHGIKFLETVKKKLNSYVQQYGRQGYVALDAAENYYVSRCILFKKSQKPNETTTDENFVEWLYENWTDNQCIVLFSEPGMGKSTLWQHIAFSMQQRYKDVEVFLIYLNDFRDELPAIDEETNIENAVHIMESVIAVQNIRQLLDQEKKVVMFMDAFDEPKEKNMRTILSFVDVLRKRRHNIKFLISSRARCRKMLERNEYKTIIDIVPFNADNQYDFLKLFWDTEKCRKFEQFSRMLLEKFERDVPPDYVTSPLTMKMLAEIYQPSFDKYLQAPTSTEPEQISISISSLYEKFTTKCISRTLIRFLKADIGEAAFKELLPPIIENTELNYQLLAMNQVLPEYIMAEKHRSRLANFHKSIQKGQKESLLLASVNGNIQFLHRSYAEYFCAKYLFDQLCAFKTIRGANLEKLFEVNTHVRKFLLSMLNMKFNATQLAIQKILQSIGKIVEIWACKDNCANLLFDVENVDKLRTIDTKNTTLLHIAAKFYAWEAMNVLLRAPVNIDVENDSSETPLYVACEEGHLDMVKLLVERGANVNHRVGQAKAPLNIAAFKGHSKVVEYLAENLAEINAERNAECLPLLEAAKGGHLDIVRLLVRKGAISDLVDSCQKSVLHNAAYSGNALVVKEFINNGININSKDENGKIPLHYAAEEDNELQNTLHYAASSGETVLVKMLLGSQTNVNVRNRKGETPLHYASKKANAEVVQLLIENGAYVDLADSEQRIALHGAVLRGDSPVCKNLLKSGPNKKKDKYRKTPPHFADEDQLCVMQLLIDSGSDVNQVDLTQHTPLHYAALSGTTAAVEKLLKCGAKINEQDKYGRSALHFAAEEGHLYAIQSLIDSHANVDQVDLNQKTALHCAASSGNKAVIQKLLEYRTDVNAEDKTGKTPLQYAVTEGNLDALRLLVRSGANIDHTDSKQHTSLHYAALKGNTEIVKELLDCGARINLPNKLGETPIYYAANRGHLDIVTLLANQIKRHSDVKRNICVNGSDAYYRRA